MKIFQCIFAFSLLGFSMAQDSTDSIMDQHMVLGICSLEDIASGYHQDWYQTEFDQYEVDTSALAPVKDLLKETEIILVFGSWCSDSRREVPRFMKILDALDYPLDALTMLGVNRDRVIDPQTGYTFTIERVPTMIFLLHGVELGRIVESPEESLETDMAALLGY